MKILLLGAALFLAGCFDNNAPETQISGIQLGKVTFEKNCMVCHGKAGRGVKDWKKRLPNGSFPAPPLNGTAHTWHHSPTLLLTTINNGGAKIGGVMPGFKDKLNEAEKQAVLDYLYSLWPKDIQQRYTRQFN